MFKSAQNLRLAAEMRALRRVANPWREARTTWFDGTPESLEARIAATERVLTFARAGATPAHMGLEREASTARAELIQARHRLMVDFLDDGARVAGKHDADPEKPWKNKATGEDTPTDHWENLQLSPFGDVDDYEGKHREGSYRVTADESTGFAWRGEQPGDDPYESDDPLMDDDPYFQDEDFRQHADDMHAWNKKHDALNRLPWEDDDPARYSARTALAVSAAEFVASQNTRDRDELAFRAARHIDAQTGTWTQSGAAQARAAFVAAVVREVPRERPRRTAAAPAVLSDFDDQLLFDS